MKIYDKGNRIYYSVNYTGQPVVQAIWITEK